MAVVALRKFHNLQQGENEAIGLYYNRFIAVEKSTRTILTNNGDDPEEMMPSEKQKQIIIYQWYKRGRLSNINGRCLQESVESSR